MLLTSPLMVVVAVFCVLILAGIRTWRTLGQWDSLTRLSAKLREAIPAERRPGVSGSPVEQAVLSVTAAHAMVAEFSQRAPRRNPVTGVQTREALFEHLGSQAGDGLLGLIELSDFDALAAHDNDAADFVLKSFAERAVRMTGAARPIAQVDRARFAIWYEDADGDSAEAEFRALCYALRDRIKTPGIDLIPKIKTGMSRRQDRSEGGSPLLSRAIAHLGIDADASQPVGTRSDIVDTGESLALERDLRQAVARHQFVLQYQPFVDAERGTVCGAEALIRWNHPTRGLISPSVFVPLVEASGLAEEVGLWVLNTAMADAAFWQRTAPGNIKVAVNLSAHQLSRPDLGTVIERMLAHHSLPSSLLELELTETVAAIDCAAAALLFDGLRQRNISISIDDFGAGYSSLSYLKKLTFDKIKIDREFVADVDTDRQSQAICQSIIALGRGLGIIVLAEGIERPEEYLWLRRHGCRYFQGYYFSRPVERSALLAFAKAGPDLATKIDFGPIGMQNKIGAAVA